ncbi:MAG TPA: hypothetical protein VNK45_05180 [Candidatus Acidoferrales bacterium]|nr:hypothetical protein [Candidatus Acidoferrales bacterium]
MAHRDRQNARWSTTLGVRPNWMAICLWWAALGAQGATVSEHEITVRNGSGIPIPIAFTVFQPDGAPGDTFPLVLVGHGWGASRVTEIDPIPAKDTLNINIARQWACR